MGRWFFTNGLVSEGWLEEPVSGGLSPSLPGCLNDLLPRRARPSGDRFPKTGGLGLAFCRLFLRRHLLAVVGRGPRSRNPFDARQGEFRQTFRAKLGTVIECQTVIGHQAAGQPSGNHFDKRLQGRLWLPPPRSGDRRGGKLFSDRHGLVFAFGIRLRFPVHVCRLAHCGRRWLHIRQTHRNQFGGGGVNASPRAYSALHKGQRTAAGGSTPDGIDTGLSHFGHVEIIISV